MATVEKRKLTPEEKQAASRLAAAWAEYKTANPGATQSWLGASSGLGSQGLIGQYLRGVIPLNINALLAICRQIGADPKAISADLSKNLEGNASLDVGALPAKEDVRVQKILRILAMTDDIGLAKVEGFAFAMASEYPRTYSSGQEVATQGDIAQRISKSAA